MSDQTTQLNIMAEGGFDVSSARMTDTIEGLTPETLIIVKEQVEQKMDNPCTGCFHEHANDPFILDFCHYECKEEPTEPVELTDDVNCCGICGQLASASGSVRCDCDSQ